MAGVVEEGSGTEFTKGSRMKVGDLVRSINNMTHQKLGYGFVVELGVNRNDPSTKVLWLRYKGETNPCWMFNRTLEKVE